VGSARSGGRVGSPTWQPVRRLGPPSGLSGGVHRRRCPPKLGGSNHRRGRLARRGLREEGPDGFPGCNRPVEPFRGVRALRYVPSGTPVQGTPARNRTPTLTGLFAPAGTRAVPSAAHEKFPPASFLTRNGVDLCARRPIVVHLYGRGNPYDRPADALVTGASPPGHRRGDLPGQAVTAGFRVFGASPQRPADTTGPADGLRLARRQTGRRSSGARGVEQVLAQSPAGSDVWSTRGRPATLRPACRWEEIPIPMPEAQVSRHETTRTSVVLAG